MNTGLKKCAKCGILKGKSFYRPCDWKLAWGQCRKCETERREAKADPRTGSNAGWRDSMHGLFADAVAAGRART